MKHIIFTLCFFSTSVVAQRIETCRAELRNDTLIIENQFIARKFLWNNGNLITCSLMDKKASKLWKMSGNKPDLSFPNQSEKAENAHFFSKIVSETTVTPEYLEAIITYSLDKLEIKRIFRLYPDCAVIACDFYYRGESNSVWLREGTNIADMVNLEKLTPSNAGNNTPVIEKLELAGKHWKINAIEFFDITDRFNNLINNVSCVKPKTVYQGNT
ncbi:hypothetical protein [Emticicia sp.]|uniref:hypothetical protein n=1 Tax=Emticicia sp. TaxID=1930953 RepID=UPI003750C5FE